jgi:hypothetical protein
MKITINETNEVKTLFYGQDQMNHAQDLVGNHGALADGQFTYSDETDTYHASAETFAWWDSLTKSLSAAEARAAEVKLAYGNADAIVNEIGAIDCDLEDMPGMIQGCLDKYAGIKLIGGSFPNQPSDFVPISAFTLEAILAELKDARATRRNMTEWAQQSLDCDIDACAQALQLDADGVEVLYAKDQDGYYFARRIAAQAQEAR